jgi:Ca2+-binding EF-hand superfamily protein
MKTKTVLLSALAAATVIVPAVALADRGERGERAEHMLERVDTDKNGAISQAEFTASRVARFDNADANKDGLISKEEMVDQIERRRAERRVEWMFERVDSNNDGALSKAETEAVAEKRFARLDRDDSGSIEKDEMRRFGKRGHKRRD